MRDGKEYGSNFYMLNGRYYYENATQGKANGVAIPERSDSVGWIHSHQKSAEIHANIFAMGNDTETSERRGVPGYVVTPIGDIQKYTPSGRAFGSDGDLGTLQWIYYSWWLSHRNGKKWWYQKNDMDRTLDDLRVNYGSIVGRVAYETLWYSCYE